jgi:hypothetical protein
VIAENIPGSWLALATTMVVTIPPFINAIVNLGIARRARKEKEAADKNSAVQQNKILNVAVATHILVNSQYGTALALIVEKAARIYEISRSAEDKADLDTAKQKLAEHEAKQHVVDAQQ